MKSKQKGFGHLGLLLAIVLIAAVGFAGWYVWDNKKQDSEAKAYYRCAPANEPDPEHLRCVIIAGPKADPSTCAPAYKLLGNNKEEGIETKTTGIATCEGIGAKEVHFFDENGQFIETKPSENGTL